MAKAAAEGLSLEAWLRRLAEPAGEVGPDAGEFRKEHGLLVYHTGHPVPLAAVNDAVELIRQERESGLLNQE
jgi:hypothetical protein